MKFLTSVTLFKFAKLSLSPSPTQLPDASTLGSSLSKDIMLYVPCVELECGQRAVLTNSSLMSGPLQARCLSLRRYQDWIETVLTKLQFQYLMSMNIFDKTRPNVLPDTEYVALDPFSGQSVGWVKAMLPLREETLDPSFISKGKDTSSRRSNNRSNIVPASLDRSHDGSICSTV